MERTHMAEMHTDKIRKEADFSRLQEEHTKAIQASKDKIEKWERFKGDYEALQARLYTLPNDISHDIMVPFGKFAFMPGKLYHTNEVLVLLGDNWFVKTSTKQALEIVEKRKKYVTEMLEDERKQFDDWEKRYTFTKDFQSAMKEHHDTIEIKEDYVPKRDGRGKARKAWVPKANVPPPRRVSPSKYSKKARSSSQFTSSHGNHNPKAEGSHDKLSQVQPDISTHHKLPSDTAESNSKDLWAKLEELSLQEERHGELENEDVDIDSEQDPLVRDDCEPAHASTTDNLTGKDYSTVPRTLPASIIEAGSLQHPNTTQTHYQSKEQTVKDDQPLTSPPQTITVTHGEASSEELNKASNSENLENKALYSSPADIFSQFVQHESDSEQEAVPSRVAMVKRVKWGPNRYSDETERSGDCHVTKTRDSVQRPTANKLPFTGQVVERESPKSSVTFEPDQKKVSRFKAGRQRK